MALVYRLEKTPVEDIMEALERNAKTLSYHLEYPESDGNVHLKPNNKRQPDIDLRISEEIIWAECEKLSGLLKPLKMLRLAGKLENYTKKLLEGINIKSSGYASGGGD